jgi:hypothetical protein
MWNLSGLVSSWFLARCPLPGTQNSPCTDKYEESCPISLVVIGTVISGLIIFPAPISDLTSLERPCAFRRTLDEIQEHKSSLCHVDVANLRYRKQRTQKGGSSFGRLRSVNFEVCAESVTCGPYGPGGPNRLEDVT